MKRFFILCLLLAFAGKLFAQVDTAMSQSPIKTDYLKKSKTQKTLAWVMLGAGTTMIAAGFVVADKSLEDPENPNFENAVDSSALIVAGLIVDVVSIPFFISASKNKHRALSVSFKNELAPQLRQGSIVQTALPSVSFVIRL